MLPVYFSITFSQKYGFKMVLFIPIKAPILKFQPLIQRTNNVPETVEHSLLALLATLVE